MSVNVLITGPPRGGKTTVVERTVDRIETAGHGAGGMYCPERRLDGERIGFDIVDVVTGSNWELARVDRESGPRVGKYRVNVPALDAATTAVFGRARRRADVVVIDEIAPMQLESDAFVAAVQDVLAAERPTLAAVSEGEHGFLGEVKAREDVSLHAVTPETRDALPAKLATTLLRAL